MTVSVLVGLDPSQVAAAYAVRHVVFVVGQGVPVEIEVDAADEGATHLLALVDGVPMGAARLVDEPPDTGIIGRVSVLAAARGRGVGRAVMAAAEQAARQRGLAALELHAQVPVRGFYERLGYTAFGPEYDEAGIRHVSMRKRL